MIKCFRAVGQVLHLLQDSSVPAHVRNDFSQGHTMVRPVPTETPLEWIGNGYELYVKRNNRKPWFESVIKGNLTDPFITQFWDTGQLDENYNGIAMDTLGLAEYTNFNFLSAYTMFIDEFPFPKAEHCEIIIDAPPNGIPDLDRKYLSSTNGHPGEEINPLAIVGYLNYFRKVYADLPNISNEKLPVFLDEACYEEYAKKLIPRAVGYSAELLDYFFRGTMDAKNLSITYGSSVAGDNPVINFEVVNTTPSPSEPEPAVEPMQNGSLDLVCRYTPPGGGDMVYEVVQGIYTVSETDPINTDYVSLAVPLAQNLPFGATDLAVTLVYRGGLGNETDAVVATAIPRRENFRIAYYHQSGGPPNLSNVYASFADGTDQRAITTNSSPGIWYFEPAWSPDGTLMAITEEACGVVDGDGFCVEDYSKKIAIADLSDGSFLPPVSISDPYFETDPALPLTSPVFSQDGGKIVAIVDKLVMAFNGIVIYDLGTGYWNYLNGFEFWDRKETNGSAPAWSPVRDEILYYVHKQPDPITDIITLDQDIYLIDADGSNNRRLTDDDYANIHPAWSPGGDWIVFASNRDGQGVMDLWLMNREGGELTKIRDCTYGCFHPGFSPDGLQLAYEESSEVYFLDLTAGGDTVVTSLGYKTTAPAWSPYLTEPTVTVDASATTINPGEQVTLTWTSEHADMAEFDDGTGFVSAGTNDAVNIFPTETTIYTIRVTGFGGRATKRVTIVVESPSP